MYKCTVPESPYPLMLLVPAATAGT